MICAAIDCDAAAQGIADGITVGGEFVCHLHLRLAARWAKEGKHALVAVMLGRTYRGEVYASHTSMGTTGETE